VARALCVHREGHLDAFDQAFLAEFKGVEGEHIRLKEELLDWLKDAKLRLDELTPQERELLPDLLRAAALRFWISRLTDIHAPRDASLLQPKDPAQFQRILQLRAAAPWRP